MTIYNRDGIFRGESDLGESSLFHLSDRNARAEEVIAKYCGKHAMLDATSGFAAGLFPTFGVLPLVVLGAQLAHQFKRTYPDMAKELAGIYMTHPDKVSSRIWQAGLAQTGILEGLWIEVWQEVLQEGAFGIGAGLLPIVGAPIGAAVDVVIAVSMTWRVGFLISTYYQHQGYVGDRTKTLELLKGANPTTGISVDQLCPLSKELRRIAKLPANQRSAAMIDVQPQLEQVARVSRPGAIEAVRTKLPPIKERMVETTVMILNSMKELTADRATLREIATRKTGAGAMNIPEDIVDAALARVTGLTC